MRSCDAVKVETPKKYVLDGLLFGGKKPTRGFIFLHGLSSSAFAHHETLTPLISNDTVALFLHNRGHDKIGKVHRKNNTKKGYESELFGEAHEVFTDCTDDIDGAIKYLKKLGVNEIYLVGHSTGCQKSVYYLSRKTKQNMVKGVVLVCPLSDYAYAVSSEDSKLLKKATSLAKEYVSNKEPHKLLPLVVWPDLCDAQRFLSLYTPDSIEEIFTYSQPDKSPITLKKVKTPMLVILAGDDEYADRPANKLEEWFKQNNSSNRFESVIIKGSLHSLTKYEDKVAKAISDWL